MKLKDKMKNYGFWVSIFSAVILLVTKICSAFDIIVEDGVLTTIFSTILSILVVLGIISNPSEKKWYLDNDNSNIEQTKETIEKIGEDIKKDL